MSKYVHGLHNPNNVDYLHTDNRFLNKHSNKLMSLFGIDKTTKRFDDIILCCGRLFNERRFIDTRSSRSTDRKFNEKIKKLLNNNAELFKTLDSE